jgi:hypothetical protein
LPSFPFIGKAKTENGKKKPKLTRNDITISNKRDIKETKPKTTQETKKKGGHHLALMITLLQIRKTNN